MPNTARTQRDYRRRSLGQNFLVSEKAIDLLIRYVRPQPDDLIVELGAGRGPLTIPLARSGASVIAVEKDPIWVERLKQAAAEAGVARQIRVVNDDLRTFRFPSEPYRVVSAPPFNLTTALLSRLLDTPSSGPWRADLLLQDEVVRKRAVREPAHLRTAAWAPWWTFAKGPTIPRWAFRPVPSVDTSLLTIVRRDPPVLPTWLAADMRDLLRPHWQPPVHHSPQS